MNKELQRAQDMLAAMQGQRDNALNSVVLAHAEIADLKRQLNAAASEIEQLQKAAASEVAQEGE